MVYQSSTTIRPLCNVLPLDSNKKVPPIGEVEDAFVITRWQRVLISIISIYGENTLILAVNNVRQLMDVDIQLLD